MIIYNILFIFLCGWCVGISICSLFLRFLKNKKWLRISLTTKFYNDFSVEKCGVEPVKKVRPLPGIEND